MATWEEKIKKEQRVVKLKVYLTYLVIVSIILGAITLYITNQLKRDVITNCKVIELQNQPIINGNYNSISTEIRYLVITDKETLVCKNSSLNGKFNNSEIFFRLKKDSVYTFKVNGFGKNMLFDYRNILEVNN